MKYLLLIPMVIAFYTILSIGLNELAEDIPQVKKIKDFIGLK